MRKPLLWFIFLGWIVSIPGLKGQALTLQSIIATYDGQDLPAYKLKVPTDESATKAAIRSHLQTGRLHPVWQNGWWVCQQVSYPPVSTQHQMTLAFATRRGDSTTILLVALDQAGNPIVPETHPALSYRLLKDFGQLGESLASKRVRYEHLFDELPAEPVSTAPTIDLKHSARSGQQYTRVEDEPSPIDQEALLQAYRDTIRILKDGIYGYEILLQEQQAFIDTLLLDLKKKPRKSSRTASTTTHYQRELEQLKDSLSRWKAQSQQQALHLKSQEAQIDSLSKVLAEPVPGPVNPVALSEAASITHLRQKHESERVRWQQQMARARTVYQREMKVMQERYFGLEKSYNQLVNQVTKQTQEVKQLQTEVQTASNKLNEAQGKTYETIELAGQSHRRLRTQLKMTENKLAEAERQVNSSQVEIARLRKELEESQATSMTRLSDLEGAQGDLAKVRMSYRGLKVKENRHMSDLEDAQQLLDSMAQVNEDLSDRYHELRLSRDSLRAEVRLLSPYSESVKTRRRVYQQQLTNLTQLQHRIPQIEQELHAWEKLLNQREKLLLAQEPDGDYAVLLTQIAALADENRRLKNLQIEKLEAPEPVYLEVYTSNMRWNEVEVPVYCLDVKQGELMLRDQIEQYFLEKRKEPTETHPLTYERVELPIRNHSSVQVVLDIGAPLGNGWRRIACLVEDERGEVLPLDTPGLRTAISQLLEEIFDSNV